MPVFSVLPWWNGRWRWENPRSSQVAKPAIHWGKQQNDHVSEGWKVRTQTWSCPLTTVEHSNLCRTRTSVICSTGKERRRGQRQGRGEGGERWRRIGEQDRRSKERERRGRKEIKLRLRHSGVCVWPAEYHQTLPRSHDIVLGCFKASLYKTHRSDIEKKCIKHVYLTN